MSIEQQSRTYEPATVRDLTEYIKELYSENGSVDVGGFHSYRQMGRPTKATERLRMVKFNGIDYYEPGEMVMSAKAGTSVSEIEVALKQHGQKLGFEPLDYGGLFNLPEGPRSIGGVFAMNNSGPARFGFGAARDNLLGIEAVNGHGEAFVNGGAVMKNVTGFDLTKNLVGSWGTLAIFTQVTFKVRPITDGMRTLLLGGLENAMALDCLQQLINSPYEIVAASHLTGEYARRALLNLGGGDERQITAVRIEGDLPIVRSRIEKLNDIAKYYGQAVQLDEIDSRKFWGGLRSMRHLVGGPHQPLWRIITKPSSAAKIVAKLSSMMGVVTAFDWGGGLIWLGVEENGDLSAADIRRTVGLYGGHATLVRASDHMREQVSVFHPLDPGLMTLQRSLKFSYDPKGIFNPERIYKGI